MSASSKSSATSASPKRRRPSATLAAAREDLDATSRRLELLEEQRLRGLPDLKAQLVEIYKRGRSGYLRLLLSAGDLRGFARATRAMTALTFRQERVLSDTGRRSRRCSTERTCCRPRRRSWTPARRRRGARVGGRARGGRARGAHRAIDSRRDLTAQFVGELQVAHERLDQQLAGWPASGRVGSRAAGAVPRRARVAGERRVASPLRPADRPPGGAAVRNGIEIAAPEGTAVRAVHGGTVGYADGYTGFGNLVIVDHGGNNYSLYGYLLSLSVQRGEVVEAGAEVGRVGPSPAGPPQLYFELRIDGRRSIPYNG